MSRRKTNRILPGLLAGVGAVGAFFGVRALRSYLLQRSHDEQYQDRVRTRMTEVGSSGRYQPVDQPDRNTSVSGTYEPMSRPEWSTLADENRGADTGTTVTGPEAISPNLSGQFEQAGAVTTPEAIPATGATPPAPDRERLPGGKEMVRDLMAPLSSALIGLHEMIEVLRERRRDGNYAGPTGLSLTPDDHNRFQQIVDRIDETMGGYDPGDVEGEDLAGRAYRLITKVREAMQNLTYNDNDLFRIHGEVKTEICQILPDLPRREMEEVRKVYT
jgi:hypothetical protein